MMQSLFVWLLLNTLALCVASGQPVTPKVVDDGTVIEDVTLISP